MLDENYRSVSLTGAVDDKAGSKPATKWWAVAAPEYFPGLELASLLACASKVVLVNRIQYSRQSYHNRCRIRTPDGPVWLTVPIVGGQFGSALGEIVIDDSVAWRTKHRKTLEFNYRSSPYFDDYAAEVFSVWASPGLTLSEISVESIRVIARLLGSAADVELTPRSSNAAESWARVAMTVGPDRSVLSAAAHRPVHEAFAETAAHVAVVNCVPFEYVQNFDGFRRGLSTLDLLFNYGPDAIGMIRRHCRIVTWPSGSALPGPSVWNPEH